MKGSIKRLPGGSVCNVDGSLAGWGWSGVETPLTESKQILGPLIFSGGTLGYVSMGQLETRH